MCTSARTTRKVYVLPIFRSVLAPCATQQSPLAFASHDGRSLRCRLAVDPVPFLAFRPGPDLSTRVEPRFTAQQRSFLTMSRPRFCRRRVQRVFALRIHVYGTLRESVIVRGAAAIVFVPVFFDVHARSPAFVRTAVCFRRGGGALLGVLAQVLFSPMRARSTSPSRSVIIFWTIPYAHGRSGFCFDLAASIQIRFERHLIQRPFEPNCIRAR